MRVPAVLGRLSLGLVIRPSQVTRHRFAEIAEHVRVRTEIRVITRREVRTVGVRGREVDFQHTFNDDRHLDVVGLPRLGKRNRKQRELPFLVVPLARCTERHAGRAVVDHANGWGIGGGNERSVLQLHRLHRSAHVRGGPVETHRIREAAVGHKVKVVGNGRRVVAGKQEHGEVGLYLLRCIAVVRVELAGGSGRIVIIGVLTRTVATNATDVRVRVAAVNARASLVPDRLRRRDRRAVAEEVLGIRVGRRLDRNRRLRARRHIRRNPRRTVQVRRPGFCVISAGALIVGQRDIRTLVDVRHVGIAIVIQQLRRLRRVRRAHATRKLHMYTRSIHTLKPVLTALDCITHNDALSSSILEIVRVKQDVHEVHVAIHIARDTTREIAITTAM